MSKDRLLAIAGGAASALLFLAVLGGSFGAVMVTFFAQLPLFLVGFSFGFLPGLIAAAIAVAIVAVATIPFMALRFAFMTVLPVLIVVRLALLSRPAADGTVEWYPPGRILAWLSVLGVGVLLAAALYFAASPGGLEGAVSATLAGIVQQMPEAFRPPMENVIRVFGRYYLGIMIAMTVVTAVINAVFAQWMAVQFKRNIRLSPSYAALDVPEWLGVLLAVAAAVSFLPGQGGYLAQNALIVLVAPFFLVGLGVIHTISARWPGRAFALAMVYLLLMIFGWVAVLVVALGLFEPFLGLRRRYGGRGPDQEEE